MKKFLIKFIERHLKVWGVEFETNLPPEFLISEHAELRLSQRVRCKKDKMHKLTVKAWLSKEPDTKRLYTKTRKYDDMFSARQYYIHYREMMGFIWVFAIKRNERQSLRTQKVLVTVFN